MLFDRLAGFTPVPTSQEAFNYFKSLEEPFDATNDAITTLGRVDWQLGDADRFSVRYSYSSNKALNANATGNALDPNTISALTNNGTEKDRTNIVVGQYTSAFSSSMLFEARGQYGTKSGRARPTSRARRRCSRHRQLRHRVVPAQQAVRPPHAAGRQPDVAQGHAQRQGRRRVQPRLRRPDVRLQPVRPLHRQRHRYARQHARHLQRRWRRSPTASTRPIVIYQRQIGNLRLEFPTQEIAFYAQDNWKVRPNLTINYGVRWEGAANPTPEANNDFMLNALSGVTFPNGGTTVDPTQIPDQWNQWGPRVGFAWDVANDGRTVVRGYTGIYYARTPALLYAAPMNNFRVPAGDLSPQLPFAVPAGNPEQHRLRAARADRHRPEHVRAGEPADPHARAAARRWPPRSG